MGINCLENNVATEYAVPQPTNCGSAFGQSSGDVVWGGGSAAKTFLNQCHGGSKACRDGRHSLFASDERVDMKAWPKSEL
eukprot:3070901-Amphidinium_carterae.1